MKRLMMMFTLVLLLGDAAARDKPGKSEKLAAKAEKNATRSEGSPAPPAGQGFEAYRYVRTRNIFDPTRRGPRSESSAATAASTSTRRVRALALTGTMVTAGKSLAFFGGAENRVIGVGESVANFKVTQINAAEVSLERKGKALQLAVGKQITLEGAGGEPSEGAPIVEAAAPEVPHAVPGVPVVPTAGDKNEVLRRMMERRAKEEGK
jgi:hypothetical protein